jgi:hypothetical protein
MLTKKSHLKKSQSKLSMISQSISTASLNKQNRASYDELRLNSQDDSLIEPNFYKSAKPVGTNGDELNFTDSTIGSPKI